VKVAVTGTSVDSSIEFGAQAAVAVDAAFDDRLGQMTCFSRSSAVASQSGGRS
jgi:hypothetical protein